MHTVAVLALDNVIPFDLTTPLGVFGMVQLGGGGGRPGHPGARPGYEVRVCAADERVDAGPFALQAPWGLDGLAGADTVVVPGVEDTATRPPDDVVKALRLAAESGSRVASICVGAFTLAAAGLLDGLRATTHWAAAAELAARHPAVSVDPDVLFVDNGQILTSAGGAAGLDLCLHMVRRDYGAAVAADTARAVVMPLERAGGQAQFVACEPPAPDGASLEPLLRWLADNMERPLTLDDMARQAASSTRTLSRRFRAQTGTTPLQWLNRARLRRAQSLLETTGFAVDQIADRVGYGSATTFREQFKRLVGTSPAAYRRAFGGQETERSQKCAPLTGIVTPRASIRPQP